MRKGDSAQVVENWQKSAEGGGKKGGRVRIENVAKRGVEKEEGCKRGGVQKRRGAKRAVPKEMVRRGGGALGKEERCNSVVGGV